MNKEVYYIQEYNPETGQITDRLWDERLDPPIESFRNNKNITVYKA